MIERDHFRIKIATINTLLAIIGGVFLSLLTIYIHQKNELFVSLEFLVCYLIFFWLVNFSIFLSIVSGFSSRFKDLALTRIQMYWAVSNVAFLMSLSKSLHELYYVLFLQIIVFGTFRLRPKQYVIFAIYILSVLAILHISFFVRGIEYLSINDSIVSWIIIGFSVFLMTSLCNVHVRLKTKLKEKNLELERASEAKSQFLANMSHEIRTPLNGVIGMSSILSETTLSDNQKNMLQVVTASCNNLLEVINNILDYSKLDAKKMTLEKKKSDLPEIVNEVMAITQLRADRKELEYKADIDKKLCNKLLIDEIRLKQVLLNLLSNAIKFTNKGSVVLKIDVLDVDEVALTEKIRFMISDTGIGISESEKEKIFEEFSQEDSSTTRKYGGTGLGLSIASKIVKLMGSEIHLETEKNKGSKFWFDLVFDCVLPEEIKTEELPNDVSNEKSILDVLVVDDDNTNQLVTQKILEYLGHKSTVVVNGLQAVETCKKTKFDVVLMDCQMPIMDGYTASREIRRLSNFNEHVYIIALTANALAGDRSKCINAGMNSYLSKPVTKDKIETALASYIVASSNS